MKTNQFRFPIISLFVLLFLCTSSLAAKVVWDGVTSPANVIASQGGKHLVINGNFGDIVLDPGPTTIYADTSDVVVTLKSNHADPLNGPVIRSSNHESQLILRSEPQTKINFLLENADLTFKGAHSKKQTPLLIFIAPGSNVDFIINDGRAISFTSDKRSGGTKVFCRFI